VGHRDRATDIPDLMRNRANEYARSGQKLVKAELFSVAEIFGTIDHHRCQTRTSACAVSRKPDIGQKHFAVLAASAALHRRAYRASFFIG